MPVCTTVLHAAGPFSTVRREIPDVSGQYHPAQGPQTCGGRKLLSFSVISMDWLTHPPCNIGVEKVYCHLRYGLRGQ